MQYVSVVHQVARSEAGHLAAAVPIKHRKHPGVRVIPQPGLCYMGILLHSSHTTIRLCASS